MENFTKGLSAIITAAMLLEAIITYFNQFFVDGNFHWEIVVSIVFGIVISLSYKLDLPCFLSMSDGITIIGELITGILISRGSNFIHDFISKLG